MGAWDGFELKAKKMLEMEVERLRIEKGVVGGEREGLSEEASLT